MSTAQFSANQCCRFRMELLGNFIVVREQGEVVAHINVTHMIPEFEGRGYAEALCDYITLAFNIAATRGLYAADMEADLNGGRPHTSHDIAGE